LLRRSLSRLMSAFGQKHTFTNYENGLEVPT
jgi:hypothetical protein